MVDDAAAAVGGLDVLVNTAGVFPASPPATTPFDAWQRTWEQTLAVNLLAAAHATHRAVPHLRAASGGAVVNVSSRGAFRGEPDTPPTAPPRPGSTRSASRWRSRSRRSASRSPRWRRGSRRPTWPARRWTARGGTTCGRSRPSAGWPARRRWPRRCSGWPRRKRASPAARSSTSTAPPTCAADAGTGRPAPAVGRAYVGPRRRMTQRGRRQHTGNGRTIAGGTTQGGDMGDLQPRMRAADADRAKAVEKLGRHLGEGRLSVDEFDERVVRAHAAVYLDELPPLMVDLPPDPQPPARRPTGPRSWAPTAAFVVLAVMVLSWSAVMMVVHGAPPVFPLILLFLFLRNRRWHRRW